ncbi:hypothetical protein CBM2609_B30018 [Cupriavidus taiwanensis]|uniref:Uncharacterized protein n=1 Tax=Cupriavidus taiwanensis TaxID=164546 RepID=A0A976B2X7_9BURK|nr:hypothetical protein CBM2604_B40019 [Cupriavidus taiwanensis]SOZ32326.1 hypothetical protein CBM2609_B30018 [Cupriavidus taiwanensis]SOZ47919.1 hypothetical protein CBM2610_B30018 [Cupriavidus taiwanensis]SOZ68446.1 hypothetical protein CBM2614_B50021 [Cupriavidus taiwanensis]SOZ69659.1 hypothetical protein CBM2615_B60020 [Cupriavidus taiwanensis]
MTAVMVTLGVKLMRAPITSTYAATISVSNAKAMKVFLMVYQFVDAPCFQPFGYSLLSTTRLDLRTTDSSSLM